MHRALSLLPRNKKKKRKKRKKRKTKKMKTTMSQSQRRNACVCNPCCVSWTSWTASNQLLCFFRQGTHQVQIPQCHTHCRSCNVVELQVCRVRKEATRMGCKSPRSLHRNRKVPKWHLPPELVRSFWPSASVTLHLVSKPYSYVRNGGTCTPS